MICTMGFCNNVFPVYLPYLERMYLTGTQGSALISIRCLFGIIGMLLVADWIRGGRRSGGDSSPDGIQLAYFRKKG